MQKFKILSIIFTLISFIAIMFIQFNPGTNPLIALVPIIIDVICLFGLKKSQE